METEKERKEKDDTRRLADLHLQTQIPLLAYRVEALEKFVKDKFENGINHQFEKIYNKLDVLQCGVHVVKIESLEKSIVDKYKSLQLKLFWLYGILGTVIGAIIIDFIIKTR